MIKATLCTTTILFGIIIVCYFNCISTDIISDKIITMYYVSFSIPANDDNYYNTCNILYFIF